MSSANNPIRVLVAEDQAMLLGALAALLELEPDIVVCGKAANGREALKEVARLKPDVLVTDIEMPHVSGLLLAAEVRDQFPHTRTIVLTTFARPGYLRRALDAGAKGYLLKDRPSAELANAVRQVHAGKRVFDPELALEAWGEADPLSERERQILRLAGEGRTSSEIAAEFRLSEGTVRNYLSEASSKLGATNRIEAARIARAKGWL